MSDRDAKAGEVEHELIFIGIEVAVQAGHREGLSLVAGPHKLLIAIAVWIGGADEKTNAEIFKGHPQTPLAQGGSED
jgi:hypothetical protein